MVTRTFKAGEGRGDSAPSRPDETWTVKEIDAWAEKHGVEFEDGARKADKLKTIEKGE